MCTYYMQLYYLFSAFLLPWIIWTCFIHDGTANTNLEFRKVLGASLMNLSMLVNRKFVALVAIATILVTPFIVYYGNQRLNKFAYHMQSGITPLLIVQRPDINGPLSRSHFMHHEWASEILLSRCDMNEFKI